jgi:hypothetical protein
MKASKGSRYPTRPARTHVGIFLAVLCAALALAASPLSRSALAEPPYKFDPTTYDGYIFPGLGDLYVPVPNKPVIGGARLYEFPGVPNSRGFWQEIDVKKMLPADRALGMANPNVFFFGCHGRMKTGEARILEGLDIGGCRYGFAASCNELSRGPVHVATKMAQQSGKTVFGINPEIDATLNVGFVNEKPFINIEEKIDERNFRLLGPGTKEKSLIVAVRPDGRIVQVPHPERIPGMQGVGFNFTDPDFASTQKTRGGTRCSTNTMISSQSHSKKGIRGGKIGGTVASLAMSAYLGNLAAQGNESAATILEGMSYHDTIVNNLQRGCDADGQRVGGWQGWFNALGASAPDCFGP